MIKKEEAKSLFFFVPGLGFEPRLTAPKAAVLPLDDPGVNLRGLRPLPAFVAPLPFRSLGNFVPSRRSGSILRDILSLPIYFTPYLYICQAPGLLHRQ